ncbi:MAG: TIGR03560 family F420-dependent LLM class oxidoreductase [Anaerolineales bacterium]|nr:TIGR03560 family F420-dependent LLM class oxidoreductase [Anaerolineales bacterium]
MRLGLQIIRFDWDGNPQNIGAKLGSIAQFVDRENFYSLWVMDHFFQMGGIFGEKDAPMLEGYTALAYVAALTRKIRIGTLVTGYLYRYPGILAKTVTTLDVLSGGRSYLGIGAGWYEEEAIGLGTPFPSVSTRFEQLEETLQIIRQMWKDDPSPYQGEHYCLAEPINHPQPLQLPHPPILVGSEGEKIGIRLVAQYADACNFFFGAMLPDWSDWQYQRYQNSIPHLKRKWSILEEHCAKYGRSPKEIEFTVLGTIKPSHDNQGNSPQELIDYFGKLNEIGVDHIIVNIPNAHEMEPLEILAADVLPFITHRS